MTFNSLLFLAFFAVVLVVHNLRLPWSLRKFNLLWLSYLFYAAWNPPFVILLWISTLVDWWVGGHLGRAETRWRRRLLLLVSLSVNLGVLSYFKYGSFLAENFATLMHAVGIEWSAPGFDIVLPVGISFYTFQTLSYTLDIYRRRIQPWPRFLDFALFVTFFPQLVAGPIVRAREFLPQCVEAPRVSAQQFGWGLYLLLIGLFEKIVIADGLLASGVERVFDGSAPPSTLDAWGRRLRLHGAGLLRLLGLLPVRDRRRQVPRLPTADQLPLSLRRRRVPSLLATLAHISLDLAQRLRIRQPARARPRKEPGPGVLSTFSSPGV